MDRKPIFDLVRRMLGRGFRRSEVAALDAALEAGEPDAPEVPFIASPRSISPAGLEFIRRFEGCARRRPDGMMEAYPDPGTGGAPWTIGWGATGPEIGPGTVWSQEQCDLRLAEDVARHAADVAMAIGNAPTTQSQFDALVSFHFNTGAIARATLTRKHKAGDFAGAAAEFGRWTRAGGRALKGLERRRNAEKRLYLTAWASSPPSRLPQH